MVMNDEHVALRAHGNFLAAVIRGDVPAPATDPTPGPAPAGFDGGAREPVPPPRDAMADHQQFVLEALRHPAGRF